MKIKIKEKPKLKTCEMTCDRPLHLKLDKFEITSYMNKYTSTLIIGKPGQGKTSLLFSLFENKELFHNVFHNVYLFQPSLSRNSMKNKLFENGVPDSQKYDELTFENLSEAMNNIKATSLEYKKYNNCIIFDDMTADLKNEEVKNLLYQLIFNRRHLHTSIFFLCQTWKSIPKDIRKLFNNIFMFKVSADEMNDIFKEVLPSKKKNINEICDIVFDKVHEWIFINTDNNKLYKGFDEIVF